ncbi:MAG: catechol 1,2-dioxygenase [Sphingomonadaceae bacterium]
MTQLTESPEIQALLDRVAGLEGNIAPGDHRMKEIIRKMVGDLFETIDRFDISDNEFWHGLNFLAAAAPEFGLLAAGLGLERFLDVRADAKDAAAGVTNNTPRTIEGPLYVAGAPLVQPGTRIDDGSDEGEVLIMHGQVRDADGKPVPNAIVEVWHANTKGNYSYFDKTQSEYNMRRRIQVGPDGNYSFRSIVPAGYGVPPEGPVDQVLKSVGRHGNRPAHIHFFVYAPGYRYLTTQINIQGDPYLHDDFAYATRDDLIPPLVRKEDPAEIHAAGLNGPFSDIAFDFVLVRAASPEEEAPSTRARALAD